MVSLWWNEEDAKKSYIEQGREEGLEEGLVKGELKTLLENIRTLMSSLHGTAEEVMNLLKIPPEKQKNLPDIFKVFNLSSLLNVVKKFSSVVERGRFFLRCVI